MQTSCRERGGRAALVGVAEVAVRHCGRGAKRRRRSRASTAVRKQDAVRRKTRPQSGVQLFLLPVQSVATSDTPKAEEELAVTRACSCVSDVCRPYGKRREG